jgi:hypothetical protein
MPISIEAGDSNVKINKKTQPGNELLEKRKGGVECDTFQTPVAYSRR